ncbi:hypothetical protein [Streptomyces sp. AV19]|uniref:hypothetical protein n=1 Tax=Streptomyces sp. AV19 TaxID=2793068 RepID=UPI002413A47F|nr:hypothetical protein [Streptomyces sp. AV19]MDG4535331.1 hypothetical protein [Streptomyces sp. AV19]
MGFVKKPKRIVLRFEGDPELDGLEVTLRGLTVAEYLEVMGLGEVEAASVPDMIRRFARALISWNLETEDGAPVPITEDEVFGLDQDFVMRLASAWIDALAGVSAPLGQSSPDGGPSPVASIPMEPLSESLAS